MILCNDAEIGGGGEVTGSSTEAALLQAAIGEGCDVAMITKTHPRLDEVPFSSDRKRMTTLHASSDGSNRLYIKGAIERVLPL